MDTNESTPSLRKALAEFLTFYIPLAVQGISMSLTYPLVGSIVSHGRFGAEEYSVFAQAQTVMFLVASVGTGLVTTGMIFARTRTGMRNFTHLSFFLGLVACLLQLACAIPPLDALILGRLYHLDGDLFGIARRTLLYSIPMNFAFFARNPYLATLFSEKRSDKAIFATFFRIGLTWAGSVVFVRVGLTGWAWGLTLTTVAVIIETALCHLFALPYIRRLTDAPDAEKASVWRQCAFTIPLSLGGTMINISTVMVAIFLTLTPDPITSRTIHYVVMGIINPFNAAALRMQSATIAFPPEKYGKTRIQVFAVGIGLVFCSVSFLLQIPALANWYFGDVQNLTAEQVRFAMNAMLIVAAAPVIQSLRGNAEGLAALRRRPNATLSGQMAYLATLVCVFFLLVRFAPVKGYVMGAISIVAAQFAAFVTLRIALMSNDLADHYHVAHTTRHSDRPSAL